MNRQSTQRRRRARLRLTLEQLESRRLMAGLNVFVFADNDGTRTLNSAVDTPAANRLVYVDLNRTGQFEDGEPLAISDLDGNARFPDFAAGNYLVGLAGHNPAQLQTTSIVNDASGTLVANVETQTLLASGDLNHVWSVSPAGHMTRLGGADTIGRALSLGGPVISSAAVDAAAGGSVVWTLVDHGETQPALVRLDLATGSSVDVPVGQVPQGNKVVGVAMMGETLVLKLDAATESYIGIMRVAESSASIVTRIAVPRGQLVGSSLANRVAVIASDGGQSLSTIEVSDTFALIETASTQQPLRNVQYSADGRFLFTTSDGGGMQVFSTRNGLQSVAYLAEAAGPVVVSQSDGRVITGNATNRAELIVWDSATWMPSGRIALPGQPGPIRALAVDQYGQQVLAATATSVYSAGLANPVPMAVAVAGGSATTEATLGVRVVGRPVPLPGRVEIGKSFDEDSLFVLDLTSLPTLAASGSSTLVFSPSVNPRTGTMLVTSSGQLSYRPAANANGAESAELQVYDGINTTTIFISLDITAVNDAPSGFTVEVQSIAEAASGVSTAEAAAAGYATVFDADADANYLITTNDPRFTIVNGQLLRSESGELDFESEPFVYLEVTATDVTDPTVFFTRLVTIPVLDSNDGPMSLELTLTSGVSENTGDIEIGQLSIYDADGYGEYQFESSDDRFEVVGDKLRIKSGRFLDYESEHSIQLTLTLYDSTAEINKKPVSATFVIDVLDMDDSPEGVLVPATDDDGSVVSETITVAGINGSPAQNPRNPMDVDNDGHSYPRDVLILIDLLNRKGPHAIGPQSSTGEGDDPAQNFYIDVNGDGYFSPLDALIIINHLNQRASHLSAEGEAQIQPAPRVESTAEDAKIQTLNPDPPFVGPSMLAVAQGSSVSDDDSVAAGPYDSDAYAAADYGFTLPTKNDQEEIDSEIELLLDELSRERLR